MDGWIQHMVSMCVSMCVSHTECVCVQMAEVSQRRQPIMLIAALHGGNVCGSWEVSWLVDR